MVIKCEYMYGSGMDRIRTDCNNWKSPVWNCPYAETGEFYKCEFRKLPTNGDTVRSMTDEELARFFNNIETKNYFGEYRGELGWLEWLKEESEGEQ